MKQFATFLLLLVIMIPLAETAHAKDEIITYEQLLAIDEPCTVYVEGKTGDPYPMHMKETLMSSTQWQWLIKDSSGKYRPSEIRKHDCIPSYGYQQKGLDSQS